LSVALFWMDVTAVESGVLTVASTLVLLKRLPSNRRTFDRATLTWFSFMPRALATAIFACASVIVAGNS